MSARAATPPPSTERRRGDLPPNPITPEKVRRLEEARLRAKALRTQHDAAAAASLSRENSSIAAGQKRPHSHISNHTPQRVHMPQNVRNGAMSRPAADDAILPAKKFDKYIEYDFSKMTDTKAGFMTADDDPFNKALHAPEDPANQKPANMTLKEWERQKLLKKLRQTRAGPFEPGVSVLNSNRKVCVECGNLEIDLNFDEIFGVQVCHSCKEKVPEKYSLLTKSEAKEDYLLTDEELKDAQLLPHMEKPNPHASHWHSMMLFLRLQVEAYAFSDKKWGSAEALDAEFEKRESVKKQRKETKFKNKLEELKKRTRVEAYRRGRKGDASREMKFGDRIVGRHDRHEHEWGRGVTDPESGVTKKRCVECGMEMEEVEF